MPFYFKKNQTNLWLSKDKPLRTGGSVAGR